VNVYHLYTGPDQRSHVRSVTLVLVSPDDRARSLSVRFDAQAAHFVDNFPEYQDHLHNAGHRQIVVFLRGRYEIDGGEGVIAALEPGDVVLADDLSGAGHLVREVTGHGGSLMIIPFTDPSMAEQVFGLGSA
jgi:hypothetical protein